MPIPEAQREDVEWARKVKQGALRSYSYDAAGRITAYTDTGAQGARASSLAYDEAGQLIAYSGPAGRFSYAYDTNGNRRSAVQNGLTSNFSFVAGSNRLVSGPRGNYRYNADGNPATDGYLSYAYDADARLILMTSPSLDSSSRTYNGQGIRVASATLVREYIGDQAQGDGVASAATLQALDANGSAPPRVERTTATVGRSAASSAGTASVQVPRLGIVEKSQVSNLATAGGGGWIWVTDDNRQFFHADDGSLLGEYDLLSDYKQETIWFNGQPVGTLINGKLYYVRSDHLGTPRSIARSSDNAEVWRWDSDPFGNLAPTNPIPAAAITYNLRFAGQQYDRYSGYFYNWMRDYDPFTGRYLQADPIGLGGGLSRYAYVGGNPLSYSDPAGLAYFARRPLEGLPWLGPLSNNPLDNAVNTAIAHEQLFFEDGKSPANQGFFGDSKLKTENSLDGYRRHPGQYNDCVMRMAARAASTGQYNLGTNNCQSWAARARDHYNKLMQSGVGAAACGL